MAVGRTRRSSPRSARGDGRGSAVEHDAPGVLVRLPLASSAWAEGVPPVPRGAVVTAAFSSDDAEAEHRDALELLGYRSVGVRDGAVLGEAPSVDFLLPAGALEEHPDYGRAVLEQARQVWDLAFGPARLALERSLRCHLLAGR